MATQRITVDIDQYFKTEDLDSISAEIHSYVWGYIQSKYEVVNDKAEVAVGQHRHDASDGACPQCVQLATDQKN